MNKFERYNLMKQNIELRELVHAIVYQWDKGERKKGLFKKLMSKAREIK